MPVSVTIKLDGVAELSRAIKNVERAISTRSSSSIGKKISRESLRIVKKLTPRQRQRNRLDGSKRGHDPFYRQWKVLESVTTDNAYRAIIRNSAVTTDEGLFALASVEFGAVAHDFGPQNPAAKYPLRWRQSGTGRSVIGRTSLANGNSVSEIARTSKRKSGNIAAYFVQHPGNAAFHMVSDTRIQTQRFADKILKDFQKQINAAFGPLKISVK